MGGWLYGLLAAVVAGALALASAADPFAVAAVVVGAQLLLATGVAATTPPGRRGTWLVVAGAGVVASLLVARRSGVIDLGVLAPAAAGAVLAALLREMLRRGSRAGLARSVSTTLTGALLGVFLAGWAVTHTLLEGPAVVSLGAGGVAVAALVWAVPGPRGVIGPLGPLVAAAAGWAAAGQLDPVYGSGAGAVIAATGGVCAAIGLTVGSWWQPRSREHVALAATVPLALAAPLVHVVGRLAGAWG